MRGTRERSERGVSIAEAAASMSLLIPLVVLLMFVVLEVSRAFFMREILDQAARQAARDLAIAYGQQPGLANSRSLQETLVFDKIRVQNIVNDSAQFSDPIFDTVSDPATVKVSVSYLSNQYGLPPFPDNDPLGLGNAFVLSGQSTYRLE